MNGQQVMGDPHIRSRKTIVERVYKLYRFYWKGGATEKALITVAQDAAATAQ
jgi:hypothetical protein